MHGGLVKALALAQYHENLFQIAMGIEWSYVGQFTTTPKDNDRRFQGGSPVRAINMQIRLMRLCWAV